MSTPQKANTLFGEGAADYFSGCIVHTFPEMKNAAQVAAPFASHQLKAADPRIQIVNPKSKTPKTLNPHPSSSHQRH